MMINLMQKTINFFISSYRGYSRLTWGIIFATFVNSLGSSLSMFLALYLVSQVGVSVLQVGFTVSIFGAGIFLGSIFGGFLADRFDHRNLSILTLFLSGLFTVLISFGNTLNFINITVALAGLTYGSFKTINSINLFSEVPSIEHARVNGLYRVAVNLGMGGAGVIGGFLAYFYFPLVFWFDGLSTFFACSILLIFFWKFERLDQVNKVKMKSRSNEINLKVWLLCLTQLLNCLIFFQIRASYPLYLNQYYHLNEKMVGYLFLFNCLLIILFEVPILNAIKNYNQIWVTAFASILISMSMFILPFAANLPIAVFSIFILTVGEILLFSTVLALILKNSNEYNKGKYVGFYQSIFGIANMLAPAIGTFFYSINPNLVWYLCGLVGLFSVIILKIIELRNMESNFNPILCDSSL